jgi:phospholipid/cholesterol/gamma-HCH transport system permease protein
MMLCWHNFGMVRRKIEYLKIAGSTIFITDNWTKESLAYTTIIEKDILNLFEQNIIFDFTDCTDIDSAGAVEIIRLINKLTQDGCTISFSNVQEDHEKLLNFYEKNFHEKPIIERKKHIGIGNIGSWIIKKFQGMGDFLSFVGEMVFAMVKMIFTPWKFRFTAFIKHVDTSAIGALPIIIILSFLIGLVVAYQSAGYLTKVGGDIFIVDLSVMSVFRELSPMITAILIAARSASSFTAEIGTMKITEEIDAMRTMGFDPFVFLVMPRVFALIITMPFLIFAADMAGMVGALVVSKFQLGISVNEFIERMYQEISINEFYVGLGKSPIYGAIVAIVGCYRGFQVTGSTDSIGKYTTMSVVSAIFWVIICDACIAVALTKLGI